MRTHGRILGFCWGTLLLLTALPATAEDPKTPERNIEALDVKLQQLKDDILDLNTQIFRLQEELLYPEDSSVVVFLSVDGGNYFALDSVKLLLDDTMVTSYLYTDREVTALKKGGIQRLYMGNVKSGDHQFAAVFTGKGPQGQDYKQAETVTINKEKGAAFVKLVIRDSPEKKQPEFIYETWH
ncbi:MAG: AraC family transcriptional regulator [Nitrospirae bacterium]|nr:AraC family transcriptional regulator [Nitrospirota bacterium]